jgi:hypothetical protein
MNDQIENVSLKLKANISFAIAVETGLAEYLCSYL